MIFWPNRGYCSYFLFHRNYRPIIAIIKCVLNKNKNGVFMKQKDRLNKK